MYAHIFQLISEFVILSIRPEDEGVFFCSAENPAGIATANFTVKVIDDGESLILSAQDKNQPGVSSNNVIEVIEEKEESNMFKVRFLDLKIVLSSLTPKRNCINTLDK